MNKIREKIELVAAVILIFVSIFHYFFAVGEGALLASYALMKIFIVLIFFLLFLAFLSNFPKQLLTSGVHYVVVFLLSLLALNFGTDTTYFKICLVLLVIVLIVPPLKSAVPSKRPKDNG